MTELWYASAALAALSIIRLSQTRLVGRKPYAAFASMQGTMLARDLLLFFIPIRTLQYTIAWELSLPLVLLTQAAAALSCYAAIARMYPKIGRFAVWLFAAALSVSALLSISPMPFEWGHRHSEPILRTMLLCYRYTDTVIAGGLLLAIAFLAQFPSPLKRRPANLLWHTALLAAYFSLNAIAYFVPIARSVDDIHLAVTCALYLCWCLALSRKGEETERWPQLDAETGNWIKARNAATEALYHQTAADCSSIGRAK